MSEARPLRGKEAWLSVLSFAVYELTWALHAAKAGKHPAARMYHAAASDALTFARWATW